MRRLEGQEAGWRKLENGQLLVVEHGTLKVSVLAISQGIRKKLSDEYKNTLQR